MKKKILALAAIAAMALTSGAYADEESSSSEEAVSSSSSARIDVTHSYSGFVIDTITVTVNGVAKDYVRATFVNSPTESMTIGEDIVVDSIQWERTFSTEVQQYSTVMFPFDFTGPGSYIEDKVSVAGNFYQFIGMNTAWGTLDFQHSWDQPTRAPNVPYLYQTAPDNLHNDGDQSSIPATPICVIHSYGLENNKITLKKTPSQEINAECDGDYCSASWQFRGTYDYKKWEAGNSNLGKVYGYSAKAKTVADTAADGTISSHEVAAGTFVKAKAGAYIPPMRAYVYYNASKALAKTASEDSSISVEDLPAEMNIRILEEDGSTLAIGKMNTITGEVTLDKDAWFDMKGRKFNKKPTVKGTYYNQGQKVIIK